jgi:putative ABC transport system ATP-binding protein
MAIFQGLNRERGITVIFVTHEQDIARHTRRILHIRDGQISRDEAVPESERLIARSGAAGLAGAAGEGALR